MKNEFTKDNLKDFLVVELANEDRYLVCGDRFLNCDGWMSKCNYDDDLIVDITCNKRYSVMKVFKLSITSASCLSDIFEDVNLELICERKEAKRMTAEEMRQKLEELTGEKIEIEPSREEMVGACYEYCDNKQFCKGCVLAVMCSDFKAKFVNCRSEELKQCYEKVMEDGLK